MKGILPRAFVGSSAEAEVYAKAFCNMLEDVAEMVPWREAKEFKPGSNILNALSEAAFNYDFGLFIFAPDDMTVSRGKKTYSTRDNVLFELGLFLGKLGPDRAIGLVQKSKLKTKRVKVPSDLLGVIMPEFAAFFGKTNRKVTIREAEVLVEKTANSVRAVIKKHGPNMNMNLLSSFGFREKEQAFAMTLKAERIDKYIGKLQGKQLIVVARKDYDGGIAEEDREIAKSKIYKIPTFVSQNLTIQAKGNGVFKSVQAGDMIEGYLLLVPPDTDIRTADTLAEMFQMGCLQICKRGFEVQGKD
jgi:hypothetical protein